MSCVVIGFWFCVHRPQKWFKLPIAVIVSAGVIIKSDAIVYFLRSKYHNNSSSVLAEKSRDLSYQEQVSLTGLLSAQKHTPYSQANALNEALFLD